MTLPSFLDKGQFIPDTKTVLQEEGTSQALERALAHDPDPVTQDVCLVHVVSSQQNDPVLSVLAEHLPQLAAGLDIETG